MPSPDVFYDYDLFQAFLKLAVRQFPDSWSNNDLTADDCSKQLEETIQEKSKLDVRISELKEELAEIAAEIRGTTNEEKTRTALDRKIHAESELSQIFSKIAMLPGIPGMTEQAEMHKRRVAVEDKFIDAIRREEFKTWAWGSWPHDKGPWEGRAGYRYDIELSLVWWKRGVHGKRRQLLRVYRDEFEAWLDREFPPSPGELSPEENARGYVAGLVKNAPGKKLKKEFFVQEVVDRFEVSERFAIKLWAEVPDALKIRGAPRKDQE